MNSKDFAAIISEIRTSEDELLGIKGGDYATDNDVLYNLRVQAALQQKKPSEVAMSHFLKHVVAIEKAVRTGSGEWVWETKGGAEGLKQKSVDARNYIGLIWACLEEERRIGVRPEWAKGEASQ